MGIINYIRPAWKSKNQADRENFFSSITDYEKLDKIMVEFLQQETVAKIRKIAIAKIDKIEKLIELLAVIKDE